MRRKLLSFALSAGLMAGTVSTAFGQTAEQPSATPNQAMTEFVAYTNANWSMLGFGSAENARQILGADWYQEMVQQLGSPALGTYNADFGSRTGQTDNVGNLVEASGAFDGSTGSGGFEDDEANGSMNTGNDAHGGHKKGDDNDKQ